MGMVLQFHSCAVGGEYTSFAGGQSSSYHYIGIAPPNTIQAQIDASYNGTNLANKVIGIGYGWQKFIVPSSGKAIFTVRGAAGGTSAPTNFNIDPITGNTTSGNGNKGGRGAKLQGEIKLQKNNILYLLVGMRGFSPTSSSNWGAGGGGASVVLRENPAGAYTFAPTNTKVDVLFIAGGGGGGDYYNGGIDQISQGRDASFVQTTTTGSNANNGDAGSGAGLTTNGYASKGGAIAKALLSGSPTVTTLNSSNYGGWGGGASGWYGGGGGAGIQGGWGWKDYGGQGGFSYINPLCTELFRGYATIAEDSSRKCTNPWSAYGFIEIELGRDENKYILAHDEDGYKYFDGSDTIYGTTIPAVSNEWQLLPDQTSITDATYAMYGSRAITNVTGLKNPVRFLVSSTNPTETLYVDGYVANTIVKMKNDVSMADISVLTSIVATTKLVGTTVKFAISKNQGTTWQTYSSGIWTDIDISDSTNFRDNGYDMSFFSSIPLTDWQSYSAKTLRFAFCITQSATTGTNSILSSIDYVADLVGSWKHFAESQASYEYITDDTVEITFKEAGNYKVNYLDSIT